MGFGWVCCYVYALVNFYFCVHEILDSFYHHLLLIMVIIFYFLYTIESVIVGFHVHACLVISLCFLFCQYSYELGP